jgi:hypothetical protein
MGMQVALWIGAVAVFSLAQAGMIMAWVMAGRIVRLAQEGVTGTKLLLSVHQLILNATYVGAGVLRAPTVGRTRTTTWTIAARR